MRTPAVDSDWWQERVLRNLDLFNLNLSWENPEPSRLPPISSSTLPHVRIAPTASRRLALLPQPSSPRMNNAQMLKLGGVGIKRLVRKWKGRLVSVCFWMFRFFELVNITYRFSNGMDHLIQDLKPIKFKLTAKDAIQLFLEIDKGRKIVRNWSRPNKLAKWKIIIFVATSCTASVFLDCFKKARFNLHVKQWTSSSLWNCFSQCQSGNWNCSRSYLQTPPKHPKLCLLQVVFPWALVDPRHLSSKMPAKIKRDSDPFSLRMLSYEKVCLSCYMCYIEDHLSKPLALLRMNILMNFP